MTDSATHPLATSRDTAEAFYSRRLTTPLLPIGALLATIFLAPAAAHAISGQGTVAIKKWQSMDKCAAQAQQAFPDFTAEANAKRDAKLKECLASQNLPPRETASPVH